SACAIWAGAETGARACAAGVCWPGTGGTAGARPFCAREGALTHISAAAPSKRLLVIRIVNFLDRTSGNRPRQKSAFTPLTRCQNKEFCAAIKARRPVGPNAGKR